MAQGFLQSFDTSLTVCSAGTEPAEKVSTKAVQVMQELGIDISDHQPESVELYLGDTWDFVITVCDDANETCPVFLGQVNRRLHIGFEDPSKATGSEEFILSEFHRIRDEIRAAFYDFYIHHVKSH